MKHETKGEITLLFSSDDEGLTIEIEDKLASVNVIRISVAAEDVAKVLSRLGNVKCTYDLGPVEHAGKLMETKNIKFQIAPKPKQETSFHFYSEDRKKVAKKVAFGIVEASYPAGWEADNYYGSRDSFWTEDDGSLWAQTKIRRWIDPETSPKWKCQTFRNDGNCYFCREKESCSFTDNQMVEPTPTDHSLASIEQ